MRTLHCGVVVSTVLLLSACQEGPAAPTSPTAVPDTQTSQMITGNSGPLDVPGPQAARVTRDPSEVRVDRRAAGTSDNPGAAGPGRSGAVGVARRAASASGETTGHRPYPKPEVTLRRSADGTQITADWPPSSDPHVNNYEVQWAPADATGWWPRGEDYLSEPPFTFTPEVGGMSPHGAWKVRVRARQWHPNVSSCCLGPWGDTVVIGEYGSVPLCYVGQVMEPGDSCELLPGVDGVPGPRVEVTPDGSQVCAYHSGGGSPLCYTDAFRTAPTSALHAAIVRIAGTNNFLVERVPEP